MRLKCKLSVLAASIACWVLFGGPAAEDVSGFPLPSDRGTANLNRDREGPGLRAKAGEELTTTWDNYLWQTYRTSQIAASADNLVRELRAEVQKIVEAGPLAPMRTVYADLEQDPYFIYWQPGRIITTLAMAYSHLGSAQQKAVRTYVQLELGHNLRAAWTPKGFIPPDNGARRELHGFHEPRGWDRYWSMWGAKKPTMGCFYGLWLYAHRSGDWDAIRAHYSDITQFYSHKAGQCDLYGTMGAHIAMARIARRFNDAPTVKLAVSNAVAAFLSGTNFAIVEAAAHK